jgi:putative tricarboxylic transport membrane protein
MHLSDRVTGSFLVGLGAIAAYGGSRLPPVPGQQVGPNVFPMVIGIGLAVCGVMIALRVGHTFEEEAEADLGSLEGLPHEEAKKPHGLRGLLVLLPPALLLFYVFAVERLGLIVTAAAIVLISALAFGARLRLALPLAALAPFGVHLVFYKLLRVPLPDGLVPMPW